MYLKYSILKKISILPFRLIATDRIHLLKLFNALTDEKFDNLCFFLGKSDFDFIFDCQLL